MRQNALRSPTALRRADRGATAVEYGLIAAVIALGVAVSINDVRRGMTNAFDAVTAALGVASGGQDGNGSELPGVAAPAVAGATVPAVDRYLAGQPLDFTLSFDSEVVVSGTPRIALSLGANGGEGSLQVYADYVANVSTSTHLVFRYSVQAGDSDQDGITVGPFDLNGATLSGTGGAATGLDAIAWGDTAGVLVGPPAGPAYAWGWGGDGRLGTGSTQQRLTPFAVAMPSGTIFTQVESGFRASCGVAAGGALYCWGSN